MTTADFTLDLESLGSNSAYDDAGTSVHQSESFSVADLERWRERGLISRDQLANILNFVGEDARADGTAHKARVPGLNLVNIAYYFGGFMVLLAFTYLLGTQWFDTGENGQIALAMIAIGVPLSLGIVLRKHDAVTPGNLLIFAATGITPLLVYTVQQRLGFWPGGETPARYHSYYQDILPSWIAMELIAIAASLIAVAITRFPLTTLLTAFWTWYLSMDLARWIARSDGRGWDSDLEFCVSSLIGVVMIAFGIELQRRIDRDFSLWLYLFGHVTFFASFSRLALDHEAVLGWLIYPFVYVGIAVVSVWLQRKVFLVFGAIGVYAWATYLVFEIFDGAIGVSLGLAVIGLLIVLSAVAYRRSLEPNLQSRLGQSISV